MTTQESEQESNYRSGDEVAGEVVAPEKKSLLVELWKYSLLIGMGGLIALLSSYLVRQFGY